MGRGSTIGPIAVGTSKIELSTKSCLGLAQQRRSFGADLFDGELEQLAHGRSILLDVGP